MAGIVDYPKVLDFGLAKVTEQQMRPGSLILTQEGMVFGTPEFMSPEQARGQTLDARSDIYSLAVILYEVLTGKLPFDAKTPMEYVGKHVTAAPIPLNERVFERKFASGLEAALAKALSKSPDDRFQTAKEFAAALSPFATKEKTVPPPPAREPEKLEVVAAPAPSSGGLSLGTVLMIALLCVLLGGGLAVGLMRVMR
jgi:serine/threonine protein kinase